jgi:hypothetical protein
MIHIHYNEGINDEVFDLWLKHYNTCNFAYSIVIDKKNTNVRNNFSNKYFFLNHLVVDTAPTDSFELTVEDFIFAYECDDNDNMMLTYNFIMSFTKESICIGKVFHVPVENKPNYTTFEIPDFILYKHANHTNYTKDGIKINGGKKISDNMVCFSLKVSPRAYPLQYFEHGFIYGEPFSRTIYNNVYQNLFINKEKLYGILWFPKSACSTISTIFCKVNDIRIHESNMRSLTYFRPKYRFNHYLQNIEVIGFVRNPYHRFLSTFIEKHVNQTDHIYNNLRELKKFTSENENNLNNLIHFINSNYLTNHFLHVTKTQIPIDLLKKPLIFYKIEDKMNLIVYNFLSKFHKVEIYKDFILNCHVNKTRDTIDNDDKNKNKNKHNVMPYTDFGQMSISEWKDYKRQFDIDYDTILQYNPELREKIYEVYKNDFTTLQYQK